ncbi:MAG: adenylosuccinate lyase [Candidatus Caldatribacteriota bacterium]
MINRYKIDEIAQIWTDTSKFSYFLKVELALLEALSEAKEIPADTSKKYQKVKINLDRIEELEKTVHHDVIAFTTSITEQVEPDAAKYFHFGCTSSDIIDTALSLQLKDSLSIELQDLEALVQSLWKKALATKYLFTLGRSHGMFAEPMSFGTKFLSFVCELVRRKNELIAFQDNLTGQMSGAVGNYTVLTPEIEKAVMKRLQLKVEPLSTQIIPRDYLATLANIQSGIANALERLAIEIRHLHRSDVAEVVEGFRPGQKGSSTMPHKKNPIASENISGLARVIRSHKNIADENTLLWHERDISHSSAERMWLPDNFGLTCYSLRRATKMIDNLYVNEEVITKKTQEEFATLSSYVLHTLIKNVNQSREEIYSKVQKASFESKTKDEFCQKLSESFPGTDMDFINNFNSHKVYTSKVDAIFERVKEFANL